MNFRYRHYLNLSNTNPPLESMKAACILLGDKEAP